jgi:hypothetical protein
MLNYFTHQDARKRVLQDCVSTMRFLKYKFLKYRLLLLAGLVAVWVYGRETWAETFQQVIPIILSAVVISLIVADLWKNRSRIWFVWQTYFGSGILTYFRAIGIIVLTLNLYAIAEHFAPRFMQRGWAEMVFGYPGNLIFQPFNLVKLSSSFSNHLMTELPHGLENGLALTNLTASYIFHAVTLGSAPSLNWILESSQLNWEAIFIIGFWFLLILGIPFWARVEERLFRKGANTWKQICIRSILFGLVHLLVGIPLLAGLVLIVPGFLFACRYKYVRDRHLRWSNNPVQAEEAGVIASTADHAAYNAILVTLLVGTLLLLPT